MYPGMHLFSHQTTELQLTNS